MTFLDMSAKSKCAVFVCLFDNQEELPWTKEKAAAKKKDKKPKSFYSSSEEEEEEGDEDDESSSGNQIIILSLISKLSNGRRCSRSKFPVTMDIDYLNGCHTIHLKSNCCLYLGSAFYKDRIFPRTVSLLYSTTNILTLSLL